MKSKTLVLACVLSASAFSFNAFSQESSVCMDPIKTICTDTQDQRAARKVYINKLKNEISKEASKNAAPKIVELENQNRGPLKFFKRMFGKFRITNQEIMKSAKSRIEGIETVVTDPKNISMLKNYMFQAIDETNYDQATRNILKARIDSVVIGNFGDYIERSGLDESVKSQALLNHCGSDGMVENAFATIIDKERYVLICPGFLITLSQEASEEERLNSILQAISHEMAHHIDISQIGDSIYKPFLNCISENYVDQFKITKKDLKYCKKKSTSKADCHSKVTESHAGELIADQWGIKVLAIHAKSKSYTTSQVDSLLTSSWSNLCGTTDEGIHPSGDFRIGTLLRVNPGISDYLSCNNSAVKKPACTLDGAVNI